MNKGILKIVCSTDEGGVFTSERQYLRILAENGFTVDLLIIGPATENSRIYEELCSNYRYFDVKLKDFSGRGFSLIRNVRSLIKESSRIVRSLSVEPKNKYTAVIFRRANYLFLAGELAIKMKMLVYWHMPNAIGSPVKRMLYRFFHQRYNIKPLANSEFTRESYKTNCTNIVYPGFDMLRISGGDRKIRKDLKINDEVSVFGCIARICHDKAQDLLIQAFVRSEAYQEGAHLILAGSFDSKEFEQLITELAKHSNQIHLVGNITNVSEFYSSIDILVNSRRNVEAFGISIAEAMASGKPVLAYKLGGPSELIIPEETGWLIDLPTVEDYLRFINLAYVSRDRWVEMGLKGKERSRKFSAQYNVKKLLQIIERDIASNG